MFILLMLPIGGCALATAIDVEVLLDKLLMGKLVADVKLVEQCVAVRGNCCAAILVIDAGWETMLRSGLAGTAATLLDSPKTDDPGRTLAAEMLELRPVVDDMGCTSQDLDMPVASPLSKTWISLKDVSGSPWLLAGSSARGA